jgi:AraC family transcriptional regulator
LRIDPGKMPPALSKRQRQRLGCIGRAISSRARSVVESSPVNLNDPYKPSSLPSYADFYRTAYGQFITSLRPAGRVGADLLEVDQPAGDWSDAATDGLVVAQLVGGAARHTMDLGGGCFTALARPLEFVVCPPGVATKIVVDSPHRIRLLSIPWQRMCAWADSDALRLPPDGDFGLLHSASRHDARVSRLLAAMWQQDDGVSAAGTLFSDALLVEIVATLVELRSAHGRRPIRGLTRFHLQRVDACMRARLSEDIGLVDLASLVGLSVAHFCRAFKLATGRSPYQALVALRMQHAQQLLRSSPLSVAEVALSCGYEQPAHFAKLFRRAVGLSPSEWRRQLQGAVRSTTGFP